MPFPRSNEPEKVQVKPFPGKPQEAVEYPGTRYRTEELVDAEFIVWEFKVQESQRYGNRFATVKVSDVEQEVFGWFRTSSTILIDQLERYQDQLPWKATIVRTGRGYSFAAPKEEK